MAKSPLGQCRSCKANVFWLKNEATTRMAPIDMVPVDNGNLLIDLDAGTYRMVPLDDRAPYKGSMRLNHFITCPDRKRWDERRKRAKQASSLGA